jgi:RNA-directed DNA polymerase
VKSSNNAAHAAAETMEGRGGAKGNAVRGSTRQTQSWESVSPALGRIRETARREKRVRFTALLHHVTVDLLHWSFHQLERHAAAGVDGFTWDQYEESLESNLIDLCGRVHSGAYRAKPSRRQYIPKPDGRRRSQNGQMPWERMKRLIDRWLPPARLRHPLPDVRFSVMTRGGSPVR